MGSILLFCAMLSANICVISPANGQGTEPPVHFTADTLIHNDETQIITARGKVELISEGRTLRADMVQYNLEKDTVVAMGNVVFNDINGDVHFSDRAKLYNKLKRGFVEGLQSFLIDGGRLTADKGIRESETVIVLENASYTPCECETDNDGSPTWQINAKKVTYDKAAHRISYEDATLRMFGVPVFYTPVLWHSDNSVTQKSGLLSPRFGYDSDLGGRYTQNYYWAIAENKDATFGAMLTTRELPVLLGEYRHRFEDAKFEISGSTTYSDRVDDINGEQVNTDDEFRGHIFSEAQWDMNEKWRSGFQMELTTDDQYLKQYDFTSKDVLENELYAERFSNRNYATGRLVAFQDLRIREEDFDQPDVLPEIDINWKGDPNAIIGGRWDANVSALGLHRDDGQDVSRISINAGWENRLINGGLVTTIDTELRGDAYYVSDRDVATAGSSRSSEGSEFRGVPFIQVLNSYPLVKPLNKAHAVIEPTVSVTVRANIDNDDGSIPNEDSQDVQVDTTNLFEPNRFPGLDRIEDRSRVTYGMRTGLHAYEDSSYISAFAGQSYRLHEGDNPFPKGSGLSRQESDLVGQIAGRYKDRFAANYRFQVASDNITSQRHEFDGYADLGPFEFDAQYLYARALEGTEIDESREQIHGGIIVNLTSNWRVRGDAIYDLGGDSGLREYSSGIDYIGCCMSFSMAAEGTNTSDSSGDSGTDIMFRIGMKGLGTFGTDSGDIWQAGNR